EIFNLDRACVGRAQVEVARPSVADEQLPDGDARIAEMLLELVIRPREAFVPVPRLANFLIEAAVSRCGAGHALLEPHFRLRVARRAKLVRIVEREIRPNDLDAPRSYDAFRRARWRAAFARLPHVAI